jgi:ABC-type multidrug transport system permease subunit
MKSNSTDLLLAGVVIVVLLAALISSFLRHLKWEERLFRWRMRIFMHCLAFLVILVLAGYLYLK